MIHASACQPWQPDRQLTPAQRCRSYTTQRGTIVLDRTLGAIKFVQYMGGEGQARAARDEMNFKILRFCKVLTVVNDRG
jgi:hypothetical protein